MHNKTGRVGALLAAGAMMAASLTGGTLPTRSGKRKKYDMDVGGMQFDDRTHQNMGSVNRPTEKIQIGITVKSRKRTGVYRARKAKNRRNRR